MEPQGHPRKFTFEFLVVVSSSNSQRCATIQTSPLLSLALLSMNPNSTFVDPLHIFDMQPPLLLQNSCSCKILFNVLVIIHSASCKAALGYISTQKSQCVFGIIIIYLCS